MAEILARVEHRLGRIRDVTYEVLACGRSLAERANAELTAVLLGHDTGGFANDLKPHAHRILLADDQIFSNYNSETYQSALAEIIGGRKPLITLIANSAFGMGLCPSLGTQMGIPFTTDCLGVEIVDGGVVAVRQMYDGKLNARVKLRESPSCILSIRQGSYAAEPGKLDAEVEHASLSGTLEAKHIKFIEYIEEVAGDVDITKAEVVVGVGRGIREKENLALVESFADSIGAVLACTRPIVDSEWLPKDRQVGSSGKTIKPKLYIAVGISGAFQHVAGIKGVETIIAINKDPDAPIFNEADYGIVDDLFKVIPALRDKITEMKQ
jgi:electron transfer flavoprotein alpha subunit